MPIQASSLLLLLETRLKVLQLNLICQSSLRSFFCNAQLCCKRDCRIQIITITNNKLFLKSSSSAAFIYLASNQIMTENTKINWLSRPPGPAVCLTLPALCLLEKPIISLVDTTTSRWAYCSLSEWVDIIISLLRIGSEWNGTWAERSENSGNFKSLEATSPHPLWTAFVWLCLCWLIYSEPK